MTRIFVLAILFASPATGQDFPPFTVKFEATLSAYGQCLREAVDRSDPAVRAEGATASAIVSCEPSFATAQAQLVDDYVTRRRFSAKSAAKAAARNMNGLRGEIHKAILEQAEATRKVGK